MQAGRPALRPREWVVESTYQAGSWDAPRRVLIVVQEHRTELFRNACFPVTRLPRETCGGEQVLALYQRRGKAEAHMGALKDVIGSSRSSSVSGVEASSCSCRGSFIHPPSTAPSPLFREAFWSGV